MRTEATATLTIVYRCDWCNAQGSTATCGSFQPGMFSNPPLPTDWTRLTQVAGGLETPEDLCPGCSHRFAMLRIAQSQAAQLHERSKELCCCGHERIAHFNGHAGCCHSGCKCEVFYRSPDAQARAAARAELLDSAAELVMAAAEKPAYPDVPCLVCKHERSSHSNTFGECNVSDCQCEQYKQQIGPAWYNPEGKPS